MVASSPVAVGFNRASAALGAAALLASCTSMAVPQRSLDDTHWRVAAIDGRPTPAGDRYRMGFDDPRIFGQFGCNQFGGTYDVRNGQLVARDVISTLMACGEPAASFERDGLAVLQQPMRIDWASETRLTLSNAAGSIALHRD